MHRERHRQFLKKFFGIATVLALGSTFHVLCWSSLFARSSQTTRQVEQKSCSCPGSENPIDQRYYSQDFDAKFLSSRVVENCPDPVPGNQSSLYAGRPADPR